MCEVTYNIIISMYTMKIKRQDFAGKDEIQSLGGYLVIKFHERSV